MMVRAGDNLDGVQLDKSELAYQAIQIEGACWWGTQRLRRQQKSPRLPIADA
ncbi:MAG: hypothetical protein AAGC91_10860 [Pseudomonadota bacterium]